jgi:hypothetical protein
MPDERFIVSASADSIVRLWDRDKEEAVRTTEFPAAVPAMALRPDGLAYAACQNGDVILFDVVTGEVRAATRLLGEPWVSCDASRVGFRLWSSATALETLQYSTAKR